MAKRQFQKDRTLPLRRAAQPFLGKVNPDDYVRLVAQPNFFINGLLDVWQKGSGSQSLSSGTQVYSADRIASVFSGTASGVTVIQSTDVPTVDQVGHFLSFSSKLTIGTGAAVGTNDYCMVLYKMEGYDYARLIGGPITLSFWCKCSIAGVYSICFSYSPTVTGVPNYSVDFAINSTNTWEFKVITIRPLIMSGLNMATGWPLEILWGLNAGSAFRAPVTNVWIPNAQYLTSPNITNTFMATSGSTFYLTGIKVEPGVIATPFEPVSFISELQKCQRYYCKSFPYGTAPADNAGYGGAPAVAYPTGQLYTPACHVRFPSEMRGSPTLVFYNPGGGTTGKWRNLDNNADLSTAATYQSGASGAIVYTSGTPVAGQPFAIHWTATAET